MKTMTMVVAMSIAAVLSACTATSQNPGVRAAGRLCAFGVCIEPEAGVVAAPAPSVYVEPTPVVAAAPAAVQPAPVITARPVPQLAK